MSGRLISGRDGLARSSVRGHIRSPRPAARTIAFMMLLRHASAVRHVLKAAPGGPGGNSGMENCDDQPGVMVDSAVLLVAEQRTHSEPGKNGGHRLARRDDHLHLVPDLGAALDPRRLLVGEG